MLSSTRVTIAEQVGLSTRRLQRIDDLFARFVERDVVSGAVTLVARSGVVAHLVAHGQMNIAAATPMQTDTIFRLASMTKPIISTAILMLFEKGEILLSEPVSNFLPTFKTLSVAVPAADDFELIPAHREVTIRDLLTHTGGFGSATVGPGAAAQAVLLQEEPRYTTLEDAVPRMVDIPLSFQPGSAWEYSPAFAFDTLGRVVEIISGSKLDRFLREHLFEPLGMLDTSFNQPADKFRRIASVCERGETGLRPATPIAWLNLSTHPDNQYFSGSGGLAGTAEDYSRFALLLAAGGQLDDERVLSRKAVELMSANHIGLLPMTDMPGYRFGLGVKVLDHPAEASSLASRGTFGWAGGFGTNCWIDPGEEMIGIMLIQRNPDRTDEVLRSLWPRFQTLAYQAIDD